MQEEDALRLVRAFAVSRATSVLPSLRHTIRDRKKQGGSTDTQSYRLAVGPPITTSTQKPLRLGVCSTLDELLEANHLYQLLRLSSTSTGKAILSQLHLRSLLRHPQADATQLPHEIRKLTDVAPPPRNMHSTHHEARREARAKVILKQYGGNSATVYTDASSYPGRRAMTVVVSTTEDLFICV